MQSAANTFKAQCDDRVRTTATNLGGSINNLKETNAGLKSSIKALDEQVRSQRNTIDNFGTQIIRATVEPLKLTAIAFDGDKSNAARKRLKWLVITNKKVDTQKIRISCNQPIEVEKVIILGGGAIGYSPGKISFSLWDASLGSPWTPTTPVLVDMSYHLRDDLSCGFSPG